MKKLQINFINWGLIPYQEAWDKQELLFNANLAKKRENDATENHFIICEHPHVYTLGKSGDAANMLLNTELLEARGATLVRTNRGGDITYHGPGQIVGYPIIDLENFSLSLKQYIHTLEEVIIKTLATYGIHGEHNSEATGVWLDTANPQKRRKICAIGVKASRYITMHGFALNLNTDLSYFQAINPCGFINGQVASIHTEMLRAGCTPEQLPTMQAVSELLYKNFCTLFTLSSEQD